MTEHDVPASLLTQVRANLEPVKPLASPSRRVVSLFPLALVLFLGPPMYYEWRENLSQLPSWASWGLSALESLGGIALMALALRQAVPGLAVRSRSMFSALAAGALLFTCVSLMTANVLPTPLHNPSAWSRLASECIVMELFFAIPSLAISAWLVARALPTRPALTGAAYGLAVGLMTDAGVRLFCWIDQPLHVFAGHGGAILIGTLGGALTAAIIERVKYRRLLQRSTVS
ncbi:MAG TPA: NrsF family protein [Steroidobacteraceae bacterium]|nr:NrsF family protein [Steroidobacteraceae bacterium]